ncbi:LytR cell envelope-related transcriptional attenuator [Jatrophihabitans sp. GAS493]|uniref:LytR C-terminal domain-containing protein n=1 Tax=Jatrophihabitans sp. GAS493 TaxID=1907575 RepID=UPI000BB952FD|nr:LytR C-terminal domain-containing protein [Jatrophihabitans sp. GAS493]SOD70463.1 LytR cell envelope-related transcriptional attenuator [Jatrophihabitans sp. GAS493]
MSHIAPERPAKRRFDRIAGSLLALIGIAAAAVAIVALHHPNGRSVAAAKQSIVTDSAGNEVATDSVPVTTTTPATPTTASLSASSPSTSGSASSSAGSTTLTNSKSIPLVVLNNTTQTGLAQTARSRFVSGGWTVSSVGNLTNNIASTVVYYDPSDPANEAAAKALQGQFPAIKRVKEKFDGLPSGPLIVVLTPDYTS